MEKTVLIVADDPDYGGFLESLVSLTGLKTRLVTFGMLPRGLLEHGRFEMFVLESLNPAAEDLCRYAVTQRLPVAVVRENSRTPSNLLKNNGKLLWFFSKPFDPAELFQCMREVIGQSGGDPEEGALWEPPYLIGVSASMRAVRQLAGRVSRTDVGVIIRGETGTGKGVVAMAMHNNSARRHGPFVEVNCSAIPATLLESELFGYHKGAFTGAHRNKPGKFDLAQGGSLFLDEISEMGPAMQAKLLHVLQDGEYAPLGAVESVRCSVRIFSASNAPLEEMIVRGQFRRDLYYRLKVIQIVLPPLREHPEDVGPLREHFLNKYAALFGRRPLKLSQELRHLMSHYHWPGNVRELENCVKSVVALGSEEEARRDLSQKIRETKPMCVDSAGDPNARSLVEEIRRSSFKDVVRRVADAVERRAIGEALEQTRWNRRKAASLLGVSSRTLYNKMRDLRITPFADELR
ncbi:sigma-54 interaction domain-containing protein [Desulfosoma sp.]|uniref:sigma-54 interaction domain-containing protein n=1 Tax=Desulfosoma sp. TaxID=2603217 RepID=UPI00404AD6A4